MAWEVRNEAFGLGFFMFFIGAKKKKIELFFRNDLKSLQNGPRHPKTVFKCHFAVVYGDSGPFEIILTFSAF